MSGRVWTPAAVSKDALAAPVRSVVWFFHPGFKWGCSSCGSKNQIWSASRLSASLLGSVRVPVGNCVSWRMFSYLLCAGRGSKMLCKQNCNSICGSLRVGKKRDACLCMRNGVLLDLKIATLLLWLILRETCFISVPTHPAPDVYSMCYNFVSFPTSTVSLLVLA